jgi:hypothetical protein
LLGHLPVRYQVAIWVVGLIATTGTGAWLAWTTPLPLLPSAGALIGAVLGIAVVGAFIHTFGTSSSSSRAHR